mgnify:CR=1 FL=1
MKKQQAKATRLEKRRNAFTKKASSILTKATARNVIDIATTGKDGLSVDAGGWDKYPTLFACKSGVIDLETGRLYPPDPAYKLRKFSKIEWTVA